MMQWPRVALTSKDEVAHRSSDLQTVRDPDEY